MPTASRVLRRPVVLAVLGLAAVAAVVVLVWFQPHRLLYDDRVDEDFPVAATGPTDSGEDGASDTTDGTATTAAGDPQVLLQGAFTSIGRYETEGQALVLALADGSRYVRLEDFRTTNGPDLFVYLSAAPADGPPGAHDDDFYDLGRLRGNVGNQNYELPPDVDLDRFQSVVIWCRRFSTGFGVAPLV